MNKLVLIAGGSTLVYAGLALMMGVLPGFELSNVPAGPGVHPPTALESQGRDVYVANGCSYCHTQQVRPLNQDKVFGRPSAAGDFKYQTPELLGSERTGPDLTNIGARQPSSVWQYIHLYNPRAVVPESIMPSFGWLFDVVDHAPAGVTAVPLPKAYAPAGGVVVPTRKAEALIAYLASLKQPAFPGAEAAAGSGQAMAGATATASAAASVNATAPAGRYDAAKGAALFTANCSACHQANGEGLPGAFPSLKNDAVVDKDDATKHIQVVLRGLHDARVSGVVYGSAMPPFAATLSDAEIADIIDYERSSWGNHGKPVDAAQVAAERARNSEIKFIEADITETEVAVHHHLIGPYWGNIIIIGVAGAITIACFIAMFWMLRHPARPTPFIPNTQYSVVTAERGSILGKPHVRVYLDDSPNPLIDRELPTDIDLDTLSLADGAHRLVIRAQGQNGREGVEEIPFVVHNGPGIIVSGLRPNSVRSGKVRFTVDAFSSDDPFDPRRAEARSQIPVWVWVMSLFVVAWAVWYAARMWDVPASYAHTPTFGHEAASEESRTK